MMRCFSLRCYWAWLITHGHMGTENRGQAWGYRRRILVHQSKSGTRREWADSCLAAESLGITVPPRETMQLGGIVGAVDFVGGAWNAEDCYETDPWAVPGAYGIKLANAVPCEFIPCIGAQGIFRAPPEVESVIRHRATAQHEASTSGSGPRAHP